MLALLEGKSHGNRDSCHSRDALLSEGMSDSLSEVLGRAPCTSQNHQQMAAKERPSQSPQPTWSKAAFID